MSYNTFAVTAEAAAEKAAAQQPGWLRYKGSILIVATGIVSIIAQLATSPDFAGTQTATILTIVATAAGFILNRFTKDGITPSMTQRIGQVQAATTTTAPEYEPRHAAPDVPSYSGVTTAPEG